MNLVGRVKEIFRRCNGVTHPVEKIEKKKPESLVAVVVPRKVLTERDYKDRGIVDSEELGKYFHGCALDVGRSLIDVYGDFFDSVKIEGDRKIEYVFRRRDRAVTYVIMGMPSFESSDGQRFSSDVTGLFMIQEPEINIQKAGAFINATMKSHLLDYRDWTDGKFGVFYDKGNSQENGQKLEGIPLLKQMGVKPTEAAEFFQVMYFGGYRLKVFENGELNL